MVPGAVFRHPSSMMAPEFCDAQPGEFNIIVGASAIPFSPPVSQVQWQSRVLAHDRRDSSLVLRNFLRRATIGYQLASITAGGPAPFIATALLAAYGSGYMIAGYIAVCAVVSIVATALMPDYTGRDISAEHSLG
jgi:hypothetical protein